MTWLEASGGVAAALNRYDHAGVLLGLYASEVGRMAAVARATPAAERDLTTDQIWPRDEAHRYRLYLRAGADDLRIVAAGPSGASVGDALVKLAAEGEWDDTARIGILDTHADPEVSGTWIVNPFA